MFEGIFQPMHLVVILVVGVLLGPKKPPELGKGLVKVFVDSKMRLRTQLNPRMFKQ